MKTTNIFTASFRRQRGNLFLIGALAAVIATVACSSSSTPALNASTPVAPRPATLQAAPPAAPLAVAVTKDTPARQAAVSKLITYRSRNYGVSFQYPWQYAYRSAKTVAGNNSLRPKPDGSDGQFTLARVEIPKGFYPDTDFDSAYFTLSLNQDLDEQQCESALGKEGKLETESINGVDFRWVEQESGGQGSAEKIRNYLGFSNGTCYELELGVKTSNQDGLARELDPDQVLRRLEGILRTVKIAPAMKDAPVETSSTEPSTPELRP